MGLDGDAAFALEVHVVQKLCLHVAVGDGAGQLQNAVGERRFAVVDVGDDRKIADVLGVHKLVVLPVLTECYEVYFS